MIHCTDLIRALEHYSRGYGDRSSIDRLLALAHRNLEDHRVFAWQRERLSALMADVEASRAEDAESGVLGAGVVPGTPAQPHW